MFFRDGVDYHVAFNSVNEPPANEQRKANMNHETIPVRHHLEQLLLGVQHSTQYEYVFIWGRQDRHTRHGDARLLRDRG